MPITSSPTTYTSTTFEFTSISSSHQFLPVITSSSVEPHFANNSSTGQQLALSNGSHGQSFVRSLLVGVVLLSMTLGTVFGNAAIVAAVALERRLQNTCNIYVTSLAVTDLLIGLLLMPISSVYELHGTQRTLQIAYCSKRL